MEFNTRFSPPGKYDKAPHKTIYRLSKDDSHWEYFIQLSENEDEPHWLPMGYFLEHAFEGFLKDDAFIKECMRLYDYNNDNPLTKISKIIGG